MTGWSLGQWVACILTTTLCLAVPLLAAAWVYR